MPATTKSVASAARLAERERVPHLDPLPRGERGRHEHGPTVAQIGVGIGTRYAGDDERAGVLEDVGVDPGQDDLLLAVRPRPGRPGPPAPGWRPAGRASPRSLGGTTRRPAARCCGWRCRRAGSRRPSARHRRAPTPPPCRAPRRRPARSSSPQRSDRSAPDPGPGSRARAGPARRRSTRTDGR